MLQARSGKSMETPQGEPQGGAAPAGDGADFQVPDKFKGDTPDETIRKYHESYSQLENELARRGPNQDLSELTKSVSELRESWDKANKKPEDTDETIKLQREYYKNTLGLVGREDLDSVREQARKDYEFDQAMSSLSKEHDGKDGRPQFVPAEVSAYAQKHNLVGVMPDVVYEIMHRKELTDWAVKKGIEGNKSTHVPKGQAAKTVSQEPDISKMSSEERTAYLTAREEARENV